MSTILASVLSLCFLLTVSAYGEEELAGKEPVDEMSPPSMASTTTHSVDIDGTALKYTATAATMVLTHPKSGTKGRFFYVAYTLDDADRSARPISFAFNGGPGASSAYLHMGALGPRRLALNDDGTVPAPPARIVDNPETWLR